MQSSYNGTPMNIFSYTSKVAESKLTETSELSEIPLGESVSSLPSAVTLKKSVSLLNGVTIIVGCIVGSGIFITPGQVISKVGSPGASLVIWALSGIFSMLGALSFAELGTTIKRSGGDYAYIMVAFGRLAGFVYLWINIIVVRPLLLAIMTLSFGYYMAKPILRFETPSTLNTNGSSQPTACNINNIYDSNKNNILSTSTIDLQALKELQEKRSDQVARLIAASGLILLMAINCYSVKLATRIQDIFTGAKLLALIALIICGVIKMSQGHTQYFHNAFEGTKTGKDLSLAFYAGLFAFAGWNFLNFVTEELKNPNRNLPLAIVIAMPIITIIYLLVNIAYLAVLSPQEISTSLAVAFDFALKIDVRLAYVMPFFVALSAIGSANGVLFTSGRILLIGAQDKQLPQILSMIHVNALTPVPAILLLGFLSLLYLAGRNLDNLIYFFSFVFFFFIGMCILALIILRFRRKDLERPIKFNIALHILCFIVCIFLIISPIVSKPKEIGITGAICFATAFPVYYLFKHAGHRLTCTDKFGLFLQKSLFVVSPEILDDSTK